MMLRILTVLALATAAGAANLRVTSIKSEPYLFVSSDPSLRGNARFSGFIPDLIKEISDATGHNMEIVPAADGRYGSKDERGRWNGMIGMVLRQNADLIAADLTVTSTRSEVIDFTVPFMSNPLTVLMQKSDVPASSSLPVFLPFSVEVWIFLVLSLLITALVLFLLARIAPQEKEERETPGNPVSTYLGSVWYLCVSPFRGGADFSPKSWSVRLLLLMWYLFFLVVVLTYAFTFARVVAEQRRADDWKRFSSLSEVVNSDVSFAVVKGGATNFFLKTSELEPMKSMFANLESNPDEASAYVDSNAAGISLVQSDPLSAFVMEAPSAEYISARDCTLTTVGKLGERSFAVGTKKNSPFFASLNTAMIELQESGVIDALKKKWWYEKNGGGQCSTVEDDSMDEYCKLPPVAQKIPGDFGCLFLALGIVALVAVVISLVELLLLSGSKADFKKGLTEALTPEIKSNKTKKETEEEKAEAEPLKA